MELPKERRLGEIVALRIKTKTNSELQNDLIAAIDDTFKKHNVIVDPGLKSHLIVAIPDEVGDQLSDVVLPGGTNC